MANEQIEVVDGDTVVIVEMIDDTINIEVDEVIVISDRQTWTTKEW